ncbi:2',3'-cyclic-nucleotide 3'-phosphodiesterase [Spathaspora passalidarum NRRL Y-27907]|uniref:2',3'-cyclic-nucleotide 3'-phosphodiesterase n=1 Tax=Spathaspora passalidarum (strain NRRL Y-27907 / 11-Y1) TaxID=619300 RepID=G3AHF3_SPAPN|nr:2',3'-cyclic-nucleotide 3'-phosphodiesterase [Spathaspora passalidarum NRRL Y-27907]EGW34117.1 2',3'-cyclic-nucleotide 3'-phosphodiesterase [Spathaspora passalidarum NRRL Y-27907]
MGSLNTLFPGQPPRFEPHITITTNIMIDLDDPNKTRDDVDRILSASAVALSSLPKNHDKLVRLGRVNSQRKFFKKLYFQVDSDPNLVSFARIIRELFVILPHDIEEENIKQNPQLYTKDSNGNTVKRKLSKKRTKSQSPPAQEAKQFDTSGLQYLAAQKAADWSLNEFDPHLSLVYSNIHPIDNALWRTIKTRISDYLDIDNVDSDSFNSGVSGLGWDGGVLKLVLCEGDVNDWIVLGSVDVH